MDVRREEMQNMLGEFVWREGGGQGLDFGQVTSTWETSTWKCHISGQTWVWKSEERDLSRKYKFWSHQHQWHLNPWERMRSLSQKWGERREEGLGPNLEKHQFYEFRWRKQNKREDWDEVSWGQRSTRREQHLRTRGRETCKKEGCAMWWMLLRGQVKWGQRGVSTRFGNMMVISNLGKNKFILSGLKVSA